MTGEITLRGKVLPVGGIKEKILAAKRANIKEIILCKENKRDIEEIKPDYIEGLTFHYVDKYENNDVAGVVTGLAWTSVGGDILFIESLISKGKGIMTMTGNLGTVMKESVIIALEYIRANAEDLGIDPEVLNNYNIHIHVPELS